MSARDDIRGIHSVQRRDEGQHHTVTIAKPLYGGMSAAFGEGDDTRAPLSLEIPYAIQGERAQVSVTADGTRRIPPVVALDAVLQSSPDRVQPRCIHFGTCGGCHYQHMAEPLQVRTKSAILQQLLATAGVSAPVPRIHAGASYAYRNRIRLRIQDNRIGYSRRASNTFLPITQCPIVSPLLWRAAQALNDLSAGWPARTTEVEFFANGDDSALQFAVHLDTNLTTIDRDAPAAFRTLCATLQVSVPQLVGGGLLIQAPALANASRRVQERQRIEVAHWGSPGLTYAVRAHSYIVTRGAFFQVNRFLTGTLVGLVLGNRAGELALDLFAGAGLFSLPLTERYTQVLAVEVGQPAATDLHRLLQQQGPQHRAIPQTTLAFLKSYRPTAPPDLVVMDPPRAGVGPEALRELTKLNAPEIVYISCDPSTFARDARTLLHSRYAVAELHLLDLFPQTFHMETVAVFRRT